MEYRYKYLYFYILLIFLTSVLLFVAPIIDQMFYIKDINKVNKLTVYIYVVLHILIIGLLIYFLHKYLISKYINFFKINKYYIEIIDLILALTLTGIQKNLLIKLRYLSNTHPIRLVN